MPGSKVRRTSRKTKTRNSVSLFFNEIRLQRVKYPADMKWLRYEIFASQMIKANFISFSAKQKIS